MSYCAAVRQGGLGKEHQRYHDHEYGFPLENDGGLFERLVLEINQAGLSWTTILRKQESFRAAYDGFDIDVVAAYGEDDVGRLLSNAGIIRNRLKVKAAIENAKRIVAIRGEFGSFKGWLEAHHPREKAEWLKLFKRAFVFTGGEIVGEFLVSTGYLAGAHDEDCSVQARIRRMKPPWMRVRRK